MIINTNIAALNTFNQLTKNQSATQDSLAKLSSGLRINKAADDAAGLAISQKMHSQINGLDQATRNAQDGVSLLQTAEGGLNETQSILQRMRDLAVQSTNDTNTSTDRSALQKEMDQLTTEINQIAHTTQFNNQNLLSGGATASAGLTFQIGANEGQTMNITISGATTQNLLNVAEGSSLDISTHGAASSAITTIDTAINTVSLSRANIGAFQNRLDHVVNNLTTSSQNLTDANSRIEDVDMAKEMMNFTKNNILNQAAQSMLSQANQLPQGILQLLQ